MVYSPPCRAAALISQTHNVANLQIIMTKIGGMCLFTIGIWVLIELLVQFIHYGHACVGGEGEWHRLRRLWPKVRSSNRGDGALKDGPQCTSRAMHRRQSAAMQTRGRGRILWGP